MSSKKRSGQRAGTSKTTKDEFTGQDAGPGRGDPVLEVLEPRLLLAVTADLHAFSDSGIVGDGVTNINQPTLAGTANANSVLALLSGGAILGFGGVTAAGTWQIALDGALADGVYTIDAEYLWPALPFEAGVFTLTIDTTAPQRPTIDLSNADDTGVSNMDNVTAADPLNFVVTAELGTAVYIKVGNFVVDAFTSGLVDVRTLTLPEGSHSLSVEAIDAAGNFSQSEELLLTVDRTAPAPSDPGLLPASDTGTAGDGITGINQPAFVGVSEPGAFIWLLADGLMAGEGFADGVGLWEITAEPLTDGTHTIQILTEDLAGNIGGGSAPLALTIDTTAPQRPTIELSNANDTGVSNIDNLTRLTTLDFVVTAEMGSAVVIKVGNFVVDSFTSGLVDVRSLTLPEGSHPLSAEATDAAGNVTQSEELLVTIDTTSPTVSSPTLLPTSDTGTVGDNITSINQPAFFGLSEPGALVWLMANGLPVGQTVADAIGMWEITSEPLADNVYAVTAQAEDAAGNLSAQPAPIWVEIDTGDPQRPTIDLVNDDDTGASNMDNVTIGDTATPGTMAFRITSDPGTVVQIKDGNTVVATVSVGASGQVIVLLNFNALAGVTGFPAEGPHPMSVEASDGAGNMTQSEELLVTIDLSAPAASMPALAATSDSGVAGDNTTNLNQPAFVGTAEANAVVRVYADGVLVGQGVANTDGEWEITVEPLVDGDYDITTEVEDLAGNVSGLSPALVVRIDTAAPQRPTIDLATADDTGSSNLDNVTNAADPLHFVVTAEVGASVVIKDGNTVIDGPFISTGTDTRALTLAEGTHLLSVEVTDAAGNVSHQSQELVVTIDRTAPAESAPALAATSDTGVAGDNLTNLNQPAFVGTAEPNAIVRVYADGVLVGQGVANSDGEWEITVEPLADGEYDITTEVEDLAGNVSEPGEPPATITITVDTVSPQRPTIDLENADDTGSSDLDNVTIGDPTQGDGILDFVITAEAGTTVLIKDGNTVLVTINDFDPVADSPVTLTLAEGTHLLSVEATDAAGNISHQAEELVVTVDYTAPAASDPSLAPYSDSGIPGDGVTNINQPAFVGEGEANALIRIFADDGVNGPVLVGQGVINSDESNGDPTDGLGTWEITIEPLIDGEYDITTEVEDLAGNISEPSDPLHIEIDTTIPQRPTIDLTDADDTGNSDLDNVTIGDPTQGDGIVDLRITSDPGTTVDIKDGNTVVATVLVGPSGEVFVTLDFNALVAVTGFPAEGPHPLSAEAFDVAGNFHQSEELLVTVDFTAPDQPTVELLEASDTLPLGDGITRISEPAFKGVGEANAEVRIFANGELVGEGVVGSDETDGDPTNGLGAWEITTEPLDDNKYVFTVELEDLAGNISEVAELNLIIARDYGFYLDPIVGAVVFYGEDGVTDEVTVMLDPTGTDLFIHWAQPHLGFSGSASFPLADTPSFTFIGFGGNDRLWVVNDNGLVALPDGIIYDGGEGYDRLQLIGSIAVERITYDVGPYVGSGIITHELGADVQVVRFQNLAPAIDVVAGPLVVNGTPSSNIINYDVGPNSGTMLVNGAETGLISVDNFEPMEFGNKTALTINAGAGNDTVDMNNAEIPAGLAAITVDGGSGDDTLFGSAGDDTLLGGRGDDLIRGQDGDDVLRGGQGDDVLEGNDGDDNLNGNEGNDSLDGGPGLDTATFDGTDGDDQVLMDAGQVNVNADHNTIANLEVVIIETGDGEDEVVLNAGAGFPAEVNVFTGEGDDNVHVNLDNPAPPTVINVDGGNPTASDSVTVKGATGDDQFDVYGTDVNIFGDAQVNLFNMEDVTILEGARIDANWLTVEVNTYQFTDADGNTTRVRMTGKGAVDVFRNIVNGRAADIHTMVLVGTSDMGSNVWVNVGWKRGTDNETSIGQVVGEGTGSLALVARRSDLIGDGINLSGMLWNLWLDDIADGADIMLGGLSGQRLRLTADQVGVVSLVTGGFIQSLSVASWAGGSIQGSVLGRLTARSGDFIADLLNVRRSWPGYGLESLTVRNGNLVSNIIADRVRTINVLNGSAFLDVTVISDAVTLAGKEAFNSLSVRGGNLVAPVFNFKPDTLLRRVSVQPSRGTGGNVMGSFTLNGGHLGSANVGGDVVINGWHVDYSMGSLNVRGTLRSTVPGVPSSVRTGQGMGRVTVGAVQDVDFLAGIDPAVARRAQNVADFADPTAAIKFFTVRGIRTPGVPPGRYLDNSYISAATLGMVNLLNADLPDTGVGVLSQGGAEIRRLSHRDSVDPTNNFVYPPPPTMVFGGPAGWIDIIS